MTTETMTTETMTTETNTNTEDQHEHGAGEMTD